VYFRAIKPLILTVKGKSMAVYLRKRQPSLRLNAKWLAALGVYYDGFRAIPWCFCAMPW